MVYLTRDVDYAIRALAYMALITRENKDAIVSVDAIVREQHLPRALLRRVLQKLAKKKIIHSLKGKGGGFVFAQDPAAITVDEIIAVFHDTVNKEHCLVGSSICPGIKTCKLRKKVDALNRIVSEEFGKVTIASLL